VKHKFSEIIKIVFFGTQCINKLICGLYAIQLSVRHTITKSVWFIWFSFIADIFTAMECRLFEQQQFVINHVYFIRSRDLDFKIRSHGYNHARSTAMQLSHA